MAERKQPEEPYPSELLRDVLWVFRGKPFADRAAFDGAVAAAQSADGAWRPDEVVLRAGRVRVREDWYLSKGFTAELDADDGRSFTAGELLFKVHNCFVFKLRRLDHKYFEGLTLDKDQEPAGPPLYELNLGS